MQQVLLNKFGIDACDCSLAKRNIIFNRYNAGKITKALGILSYYSSSKKDNLQFLNSRDIIEYFRKNHNEEYREVAGEHSNYQRENNNIEVIMKSLSNYIDEKIDLPLEEKKKSKKDIKQKLIDVTFFDCLLGNSDRSDENFGLLIGKDKCTLYPIFDNEYILGLFEYKSVLMEKTKKKSNRRKDLEELEYGANIPSRIGFPGHEAQVYYGNLLSYLVQKYPEESKKAWEKVGQITLSDIQNNINKCKSIDSEYYENQKGEIVPYFDEIHERVARTLFNTRKEKIQEITKDIMKNKEEPDKDDESLDL